MTVAVDGPLDLDAAASLCATLRAVLATGEVAEVICAGDGLTAPDLATVDLLARVQLISQRSGHVARVREPSGGLRDLVALAGLDDVLWDGGSGVETRRQSEEREEPGGVEEGVEADDRPV